MVGAGCALIVAAWLVHASAAPAGKSGASPSVTLKLVVVEYPGKPGSQVARRYARRVEALSNGSLRLVVAHWPARFAATTPSRQVEASAIRALRSNDVQIGLIPSHAFEAQGVRTLRVLQAPFVLRSHAQTANATTGAIARRLQAGLDAISLTGLGLVPEGLYRPFGYLKPLEAPGDFAGVRIRADSSRATHDLLTTLGSRPVDVTSVDGDTAVYSGFVNDARSVPSADDRFPKDAYTSGNIALFPKVDVIVASSSGLAGLRKAQQAILRRAATDVHDKAGAAATERAAAAAFCGAGGTIVTTQASGLRALRAKAARVVEAMRGDPATGALLASIETLGSGAGATLPPCVPTRAETSVGATVAANIHEYTPAARAPLLPPVGSYRRAFTAAQLRAAGASETEAQRNEGVTTLTFYGLPSRLRFVVEWQDPTRRPCRGRVQLPDRLVGLQWNPATPCSGYVVFSWKGAARGDLIIVALDPRTEPGWIRDAYPGTWKRVDCTPNCGARDKLSAAETSLVLSRGLPAAIWVACHRVASFPWDYECSYRKGLRELIGARFGVDVDDHRITRTSNGSAARTAWPSPSSR